MLNDISTNMIESAANSCKLKELKSYYKLPLCMHPRTPCRLSFRHLEIGGETIVFYHKGGEKAVRS